MRYVGWKNNRSWGGYQKGEICIYVGSPRPGTIIMETKVFNFKIEKFMGSLQFRKNLKIL